ncbi:hypothetical protein [Escherichia coli]|uniref:hypothetical protein n=1 Tax=Escherichia coli TaxID=562 RepID=UPI0007E39C31|nr:hypothetical protein [Escherichia coli]EFF2705738.1 hypothetical protein [Escherichia coli]
MNKHENKQYCSSDEIWCTQRKELIKSVLETKKASDLEKQSTDIAQQYLSETIQFSIDDFIKNIKRKVKSRGSRPPAKRKNTHKGT